MAEHNAPNGPYVIQANQHSSEVLRQMIQSLVATQGVVNPGDLAVTQNGTPNMSVNVASGFGFVAGTQSTPTQGMYHVYNDATKNLTIAASDPTNPRIDIVVAKVQDAFYSGSTNAWALAVVTGTPAPSPSAPAAPANSIILAQVAVAANATTVVTANITDKRPKCILRSAPGLYRARAYLSAATNLSNGNTTIVFDQVLYDSNGNFSGGLYTAPVPGIYMVSGTFGFGNFMTAGAAIQALLLKNNSIISYGNVCYQGSQTAAWPAAQAWDQLQLAAGDTVGFQAYVAGQTGSIALRTGAPGTFFSVHFLSPV